MKGQALIIIAAVGALVIAAGAPDFFVLHVFSGELSQAGPAALSRTPGEKAEIEYKAC